tara:strand:+ start:2078 stop:2578 length:501 start_codon:yes stop_codon:yes gene_type:complete
MISQKKVSSSFAIAFVYSKKELIQLLNDYGASIKKSATNQKVLDVFKGFITSNRKFEQAYVDWMLSKGYLKEEDFEVNSSDLNNDYHNLMIGAIMQGLGGISQGIGKVFERPETNNDGIAGILALETEKEKNRGVKLGENNSKYWIAGTAIVGFMAIMGVIIIKNK